MTGGAKSRSNVRRKRVRRATNQHAQNEAKEFLGATAKENKRRHAAQEDQDMEEDRLVFPDHHRRGRGGPPVVYDGCRPGEPFAPPVHPAWHCLGRWRCSFVAQAFYMNAFETPDPTGCSRRGRR